MTAPLFGGEGEVEEGRSSLIWNGRPVKQAAGLTETSWLAEKLACKNKIGSSGILQCSGTPLILSRRKSEISSELKVWSQAASKQAGKQAFF